MVTLDKSPAELLATPVQFLRGTGPQRAEMLQRLDLQTARDVLFFFPRTYQDMTDLREVNQLEEDKLQSVCGIVEDMELRGTRRANACWACSSARVPDTFAGCGSISPSWRRSSRSGNGSCSPASPSCRAWSGKCRTPRSIGWATRTKEPQGRILPVYPLTEGLQQWQMRKIVAETVTAYGHLLEEIFPDEYLQAHDLWPLHRAIQQIHTPDNAEQLAGARWRLAYQEAVLAGRWPGRQAASTARDAAGPAAGGHGPDQCADPPPVPFRTDSRASSRRSPRLGPTWASRCP